jgi:hypothetical protein
MVLQEKRILLSDRAHQRIAVRLRACCGQAACLMYCSIHDDQLSLITRTFLVVLAQWNRAEF